MFKIKELSKRRVIFNKTRTSTQGKINFPPSMLKEVLGVDENIEKSKEVKIVVGNDTVTICRPEKENVDFLFEGIKDEAKAEIKALFEGIVKNNNDTNEKLNRIINILSGE